jgi:hypothetical protein
MTASQMKRIRTKLAKAADLTAEAHDLAKAAHADSSLRDLTATAANDMANAQRSLKLWDERMARNAEAILSNLKLDAS